MKAPVTPLYSSTLWNLRLATKRLPLGPKTIPSGFRQATTSARDKASRTPRYYRRTLGDSSPALAKKTSDQNEQSYQSRS